MAKEHEKITPQERKEELKENILAIVVVLLIIGGAGWWIYSRLTAPAAPVSDERIPIPVGGSPMLGNDSASVTVVEFSDFECPFCGSFARDQFPTIKERYIDTGKIRFVFKEFPLTQIHPKALRAALAAECAHDQNKFWEYHDVLYAHQDALEIGQLEGYATDLGLDKAAFKECMDTESHLGDVQAEKQLGMNAGVSGTPSFFFNGRRVTGALTAVEFSAEVEKELARQAIQP